MATNQKNNIFAPPSQEELDSVMFAPPKEDELKQVSAPKDMFAPPEPEEIKPTGLEGQVSPADMQKIADRYKVPIDDLKTIAPYLGTKVQPGTPMEALTGGLKETAGLAGRTIGLGVPQFIYKKLQTPSMQQAIDELQRIAGEQQSGVELAAELVAPGGWGGGANAISRLGRAATMGATVGLTGSEYGKEVQGTAMGAGIGTALGGAGELLGKVLSKSGASKVEQELATRNAQFDIGAETEKVAQQTQKSENMLRELVTARKETLTPEEVDTILKEQMTPEKLNRYLSEGTIENRMMKEQLGETASNDAIKKALSDSLLETRIKEFAEEVTGQKYPTFEKAYSRIEEATARQGQEAVANKYANFVELKNAEKAIELAGLRATDSPNAIGKALNFVSDNQFVMRGLDQKYGTKLENTLRDLNKDYNKSTHPQKAFRERLDDVFQVARKNKVDDVVRNTDLVYNALDTGKLSPLTPEEQAAALEFKKYFAEMLDFVNRKVAEKDPGIAPLSIPARTNYVPKMLRPIEDMIPAVESKIREATQALGVKDLAAVSGDIAKLAKQNPIVKDLYRTALLLDNRPIHTGAELSSRLKEMMYSRQGNIAMETKARAVLERNNSIPEFLLEKNLYRLARKYSDNTFKHLYLRNNIDKLRYQAKMLDKAGADVESQYVRNLVQDLLGVRAGTFAEATMQSRISINKEIDKLLGKTKSPTAKGALIAVKAVPDMLEEMTRQIYPNVLGYGAIRPVMQNMTQLLTKTAPELGGTYGYSTVLRAAASMAKGGMRRELARLTEKAQTLGNMPAEFTRKGEQAIAEGIQRSSLYKIPADVLAGMGKMGIKLFTLGEELNRSMAIKVAEVMAQDLAKGSSSASKALSRMPRTVQREISRNPAQAELILSKYLNDATMYNYNRVSMSEYGRTMGPLFSAFSKWPTATVGEIVNEIQSKGTLKGMGRNWEKFVTPLLLLQLFDSLALNEENIATQVAGIDREGMSDVQKKLVGSYGLSQSAPIGAAGAILKGEIFTPPAIDAFLQTTITPILEGKDIGDIEDKLGKGASSAIMNFTPGAGLFRFLFEDLVTYATGTRPEGKSGIERIASGIEEVNK